MLYATSPVATSNPESESSRCSTSPVPWLIISCIHLSACGHISSPRKQCRCRKTAGRGGEGKLSATSSRRQWLLRVDRQGQIRSASNPVSLFGLPACSEVQNPKSKVHLDWTGSGGDVLRVGVTRIVSSSLSITRRRCSCSRLSSHS